MLVVTCNILRLYYRVCKITGRRISGKFLSGLIIKMNIKDEWMTAVPGELQTASAHFVQDNSHLRAQQQMALNSTIKVHPSPWVLNILLFSW